MIDPNLIRQIYMWSTDFISSADGQQLAIHRSETIDKSKPHLHFGHATGFNANTYRRLLEPLMAHANVWAWDMRGHGLSITKDAEVSSWETYYQDMEALLDHISAPVILAGHSIGAVCAAIGAVRRPNQVISLTLMDPVFIMGKEVWWMRLGALLKMSDRHFLAQSAAKRRGSFPSKDMAMRAYRGRGVFKSFPQLWIEDYLETGLVEAEDGFYLACNPEFESSSYARTELWARRILRRIQTPMEVIAAETDSTMNKGSERVFKRTQPNARFERIEGTSHMLVMERPQMIEQRLRDAIKASK
ncbi:MAG: pimeloyl-ACP methyl ester carboxylesterase [Pseudoalteromonas tetraodonis]|jgi:pimeloyl-ACP methyl ester carboxylesterase